MPISKRYVLFTFSCILSTVFCTALAQGTWQPAAANTGFPRTLFKASEIAGVRQSLQQPERNALYQGIYGSAQAYPALNSTTEERRLRARAAKNAAFIRIINLKPNAANSFDSLTTAEKTQLENNVIALLDNINTAVEGSLSYTEWQWRSKELIDYLIAYDLLRGAKVPVASLQTSQIKLQEFAGNLYAQGSGNVGSIYNNHMFMTAGALGMAGVVLNDVGSTDTNKQPLNWINVSMYNLDNAMWRASQRQSEPGAGNIAGYAEGPYYFKYAMLNCLPFFRAFGNFLPAGNYSFTWSGNNRLIANPYYDPNFDLLYQWITEITMPDGRIPALEDSFIDMAMPEMAITGKPQFLKKFYGQHLDANQLTTLQAQLDGTVDMRANYLAANVNPAPEEVKTLTSLPQSGNLIFRSGTGFTGNYLHVYGKNGRSLTNSGGHNQGDASSFSLYAHGQLLALDAGYLSYNRRTEVGNANNHNLILVDNAGPRIGTVNIFGGSSPNDAAAYIENTFETPNAIYGEVRTAYSGANITRKTLSVRGEYYLMADFIASTAAHTYTWQLHGFGLESGTAVQGSFTGNLAAGEGTWQKNGVSLRAHVTAKDGVSSFTKATGIHETTYNFAESHTTFLAHKNSVPETQFLATLQPYITAPYTTTTLPLTNMAGSVTVSSQYTDLAFTKSDTLLQVVNAPQLAQTVSSDASLTFFSLDNAGTVTQAFLQNGTRLFYGATEIMKSSKRANILLERNLSGEFTGYSSKAATLLFVTAQQPQSVSGRNLSSWNYNSTTQLLTLTFSQPSDFRFQVTPAPLPVELVAFRAEKVHAQVKLAWQTASEKNNAGFEVQFSADGKTWKTIAAKTGQGTTSQTTHYEHLHTPDFFGQLYYRLAQRDLDSTTTFSAIKTVWFENPAAAKLSIYPNPAQDFFWLEANSPVLESAELVFYSAAGSVVYKKALSLPAGASRTKIALPAALPQGLYQVQLMGGAQRQSFRLQK